MVRAMSFLTTSAGCPASSAVRAACSRLCARAYSDLAVVCAAADADAARATARVSVMSRRIIRLRLPELSIHFFEVVFRDEHLAGLAASGSGDQPVGFHHVHQPCGPAEADAQPPLQVRDRGLAALHDDAGRFIIEIVLLELERSRGLLLGGDQLVEDRLALLAQETG